MKALALTEVQESRRGREWAIGEELELPRVLKGAKTQPAMSAVLGTETVLLVAEEPVLRDVLARALGRLGYSVFSASNHGEAQFRAQAGAPIDILLLDQAHPNPGNEQLAIWFRATYPETRILMASGSLSDLHLTLALSSEITVIAKPFTFLQLAKMLRRVLA